MAKALEFGLREGLTKSVLDLPFPLFFFIAFTDRFWYARALLPNVQERCSTSSKLEQLSSLKESILGVGAIFPTNLLQRLPNRLTGR